MGPKELETSRLKIRNLLFIFVIACSLIFVDLHFLSFFPLSTLGNLPVGQAAMVAILGGVLAVLYRIKG